jgi:hypothetical protein
MPFVSGKQRRYMNAQRGKAVPAKVVDEFNAASKGQKDDDDPGGDPPMGKNSCAGKGGMPKEKMDKNSCGSPGADKTGTTRNTDEAAHAPLKPGKKRKASEVAAYLRNKSKNKGMMTESDPSGDEN